VAEAHQSLAAVERAADPFLGVFGRSDLRELVDHFGRGATVERPLHRPDRGRHRRGDIRAGRGHDPGGEGRGVEAVLRADDEVGIKGACRLGVRPRAIELVEESLGEIE